ncbi:MAG TPA: methylthioribulose 1-phosphate dehydratase [Cyanobacteria bacterium UBA11149]|nr:methylthioribulose 1-phosphate dehydratase [Cyanobacteria bacterium UBA11366]HBK65434.1 methylthioribulose 1-phosphate dehydratase [Cyanobacteria bacterium UBA11166]HBS69418.1 methylthioribulose 1-phosphate dehydratase [Cyanobacteria bacterium UBA11153]HBW91934.1 methylthioribulose 1-phosphate dehydratase [Cyanobacteria bacterium UBA11149]HCA95997.1 methylthioribulose 1-phosphate dehydratase [Cyanobacteria bacterium UBA9226]
METNPRETIIAAASHFYKLGWMMGTAGNLSVRIPDGSFWITGSGCNKGELTSTDLIRMELDGTIAHKPRPDVRPSAETSIHQAIYSLFPEAQACYHVHSIEGNLVSRFTDGDNLPLPPLEMLKGLGVWEENPQVDIPIFPNHLDVSQIARDICDRFEATPPSLSALLIRDHGITVWASSPRQAVNFLEVLEYTFRYMVAERTLGLLEIKEKKMPSKLP